MPTPNSVYRLCECGCGQQTPIARKTSVRDGTQKGVPVAFIRGHKVRKPRIDFRDAQPFKLDGEYCKLIDLADGWFTVVSVEDHERLSKFTWTKRWHDRMRCFYAYRHDETHPKRPQVPMHREILSLSFGDRRNGDHRNGNTLDNRRENLRIAESCQNARNAKRSKINTSGFKGVHFRSDLRKWTARICVDRKRIHLGHFPTPELAFEAYKLAALKMHGEFARLS